MKIELYSVRGFTGDALRVKLTEALEARQLPYTISEIHHVDQFIKAGLQSVPAFRIGGKVIQHAPDQVPDQTVNTVMEYLMHEHPHAILVPIDFSVESTRALEFGAMMAHHLGLGLTLAHVHQTLYDPISAGALDVQILHDAEKRLTELSDKLNLEHKEKGWQVPVKAHLEVGEPVGSLMELLDQGPYEMMIMGTRATDNAMRRIFGSISADISRKSRKPVIVVPPNAEIKFPGKVVIGFTEELILHDVLDYIIHFGAGNHIFFDFVHVSNQTEHFDALKQKLFSKLAIHKTELCGFNIRSIAESDQPIDELLFDYAQEVRAGMVILVTHHRGFFENLFHSSVSLKALQHPEKPLMILHGDRLNER